MSEVKSAPVKSLSSLSSLPPVSATGASVVMNEVEYAPVHLSKPSQSSHVTITGSCNESSVLMKEVKSGPVEPHLVSPWRSNPPTLRSLYLKRAPRFCHRRLVPTSILLRKALKWSLLDQVRPRLPRHGLLRAVVLLEKDWLRRLICRNLRRLVTCSRLASAPASSPVVVVYHWPACTSEIRSVASVAGAIATGQAIANHLCWAVPPLAYLRPETPMGTLCTPVTPSRGSPLHRHVPLLPMIY